MSARPGERRAYRLVGLLFFLIISFGLVAWRLIIIQVVEAKKFDELALKQRVRRIELVPSRGTIYDRNGEELAISIGVDSIYATPYLVKDPPETARLLSPILDIDESILLEKLNRDSGFVYLARKIGKERSEAIKSIEIAGIGIIEESKRFYPCNSIGSQLIGFAGLENKGLAGTEFYFDKILRGRPGQLVFERDPLGHSIPGGSIYKSPSTDGNNIYLTIDKSIQYKAEAELKAAIEEYRAKSGLVIVMDVRNGDILAMANYPTFDLNNFSKAEAEQLRNRAVTDVYEPGSTMKVIVVAATLEEGLVSTNTVFHLPSTIEIANKTIGEAHPRPPVDYSVTQIVSQSCNVGAVTLALKLGKERLYKYIEDFGFLEKTGIDFPGEVSGFLPSPKEWSGTTIGTVPIGQGITTTALQMVRAIAAIANNGVMVRPRILRRVTSAKGKDIALAPQVDKKRIISKETAAKVKGILGEVVIEGTGKRALVNGYKAGGKTGTAQKPRAGGKGYEEGKYVASFVGFAPLEDPRLAILVVVDEPKNAIWGGVVAAPVFKEVAEFSLHRLRIAPKVFK